MQGAVRLLTGLQKFGQCFPRTIEVNAEFAAIEIHVSPVSICQGGKQDMCVDQTKLRHVIALSLQTGGQHARQYSDRPSIINAD